MGTTIDMTLVRGVMVCAGMAALAVLLYFVGAQQNDGLPLLLLSTASIIVGSVLLCLTLRPDLHGKSFTLPRLAAGAMVSVGCVALACVFGYIFHGKPENPTALIAIGYLIPMLFWGDTKIS